MKVLILTSNYPRKNALNNGIFIHQQVKALQQLGVECYVLLLHNWYPPIGSHRLHPYWRDGYNTRQLFFSEFEGVKIFAVPMFVKMPARLFKETLYDRAARAIINEVKKNKLLQGADWLYAHFLTDNGYIGAKIKDSLKVKLAAIARGDDVHAWPEAIPDLRKNLRYVFEKADLLLANSRNLANDSKSWMLPGNIREVKAVYNGIDYERFRPATTTGEKQAIKAKYNLLPDKKYLVCVGTPVVLKGWIELLQAIKELGAKFDNWQLLMIANKRPNPDTIDLQRTGAELKITDRIVDLGELSPSDLAELYRACDAFVLPSYNEGMANSLLEAMASGLACIATDVGGHNEVIRNKENGLLIKPRLVGELVTAIQTIIDQQELATTMGIKARDSMIALGDYLKNAGQLLDMLRQPATK